MLFKKVRRLFSHRDDSGYDGDRQRDGYMDVLKQIQSAASAKQPSEAARETAQDALERLETSRTRSRGVGASRSSNGG